MRYRYSRQMLLFGSQRLVSPLDWSNTMRAWDGIKATYRIDGLKAAGFWTQFAPVDK